MTGDAGRAGQRPSAQGQPAVFLDRDGVLNELVLRGGAWVSPRTLDDFVITADAPAALERLRALGVPVFVVTNQPDLARGHMDAAAVDSMTAKLTRAMSFDAIRVCPHDDRDECDCRKPKPGMLLDLARQFGVDLGRSFMIGDSWRDIEAGRSAGCVTMLIGAGPAAGTPAHHSVPSLLDAVAIIESVVMHAQPSHTTP